jgi:hypothetical protein
MEITRSKIAAFFVAIILVVMVAIRSGSLDALQTTLEFVCPLIMIWFPDEIGSLRSETIDKDTPGIVVCVLGWILLVAVVILVVLNQPR